MSFGARVNVLHVSVPGRVWRQEERDARRQQQLVEIHSVKRARRYTEREDNRGCLLGRLRGRGGQWSITNRIHLSAWLIFPIKTAQQGPQQSTSWNRGYFSACLSPGCVCVCVSLASILAYESADWGSIKIFHRNSFNTPILISFPAVVHKQIKSSQLSAGCFFLSPCWV